jgi:PAS domain S-box-containing protein
MKLHLTSRIVLFFMVLAAVLLTIVGVLAYRSGSKNLKAAAIAEMLATAVEKDAELNGWTDERLANLEHFTRHPNVVEIVTSLIASAPASAEARAAVRRELESQISGPHGGFTEVFLVEPDSGEVVVSTRLSAEGKSLSGQRYFENGKAGLYLQPAYYSADLGFPVMTVAAPLRAPDGRVVAVLAAHIDLAALTEMAQRRTGLRQTEDAFLINAKGFPITQPRFLNDPVALRRKFDTEVVRRCAAGNSGVILAADYRGVPSIAVYRWNASHHFGLIVKIDQAEALAPVRAFGRQVILISGLGLVASALLALFLARTITQPLRILQTDVQRFGKEENAPPLPESVGDEVGLLAREFNQMAAQVAERTAELRSAHAQLEQMLMHSPAVTYRLKVEGEQIIPITASANVTKLLGFALEETLSMEWWFEQLHPEDRDRATASIPEMLSQVTSRFEYRLRHKAGGYRWLDDQRRLLRDSNGQPSEIIGVWVDITERKQVEAALRSSEARSRSIIESAHDAFISLDVSGRIRDWNHQAEKIFGWPRAEALGRFLHETIIPEKHRAGHLRGISHLQATGEGAVLDQRLELTALRRNGEEFPLEMTIWALQMGDETIYNAFLHDITERKRLEAQLFESRKRKRSANWRAAWPTSLTAS